MSTSPLWPQQPSDLQSAASNDPSRANDDVVQIDASGQPSSIANGTSADNEHKLQLRKKILEIQSDPNMSDKQKAVLMQTLMTKTYFSLSYIQPLVATQELGHALSALTMAKTYNDEEANILGCKHYQRNCKLQCSTCYAWATCRFCHNEEHSSHELIRTATSMMMCMFCTTSQEVGQYCANPACGKCMAQYYCAKCKLWDNDPNKRIYHCADCGICRVGRGLGKDFFHCNRCNVCMSMALKDSHRCIEHSTECDCPICGEYMFNSTATVVFMTCGHSIHQACYHEHVKSNYKCPTCSKSLSNMDSLFRQLDHQIAGQPMPVEYDTWKVKILCNDCSSRSTVPYHFLGAKCLNCLSYNTVELDILRQPAESVAT